MALHLNKLTALTVAKLSKPGYYSDGGGLWLQVARSGSKSWIFRFTKTSRRREMGLGDCVPLILPRRGNWHAIAAQSFYKAKTRSKPAMQPGLPIRCNEHAP